MPVLLYQLVDGTRTVALEVDLVFRADTSAEYVVTTNPMESGADTADHVTPKPKPLEVEAAISDRGMDGVVRPGRAREGLDTLQRLADTGARFIVVTPTGERADMLLTRLNAIQRQEHIEAVRFTASFTPAEFAESQQVPAATRKEPKTKPKVEMGQQTGGAVDDAAQRERAKTLLKEYAVDPLVSFFKKGSPTP